MEVSILELLALFVTFGAESFVKGTVILLTEGIQNLRLDGLLTLIAITHGNVGGLMKLTRYPEQMRENVKKFDVKKATDSWNKIRDLRYTLIQYLLHQNRFGTGEDETTEREEDVKRDEDEIRQQSDTEESRKDEGAFGDIDKSCQFSEKKTIRRGHGFGTR